MPPNTVYVGRPSRWGNPFCVGQQFFEGEPRFEIYGHLLSPFEWEGRKAGRVDDKNVLALFRAYCEKYMERGPGGEWLERLQGKDLACWCNESAPCHADILLELANA